MMKMTQFVISLAPVGIAALIANTVATSGPSIFISLLPYVLTVALALAIHFLVTLPLLLRFFTGYPPYRYMRAMSPALWTAFSTASSSGTLAVTMERARQGAGVSNRITSFVLPLGATVNMDGTALYECVTVLFIAQVHASTHPDFPALTLGGQLFIVFLALTVSIGAAGIPHAGLVMMVIILQAVHLPLEYTSLIWGVDRILDMSRTMTNVWSDATGAAVIAHSENEIEESVLFSS
jgi:Na+/H+-dicarboxylate symporter